MLCKLRSVFIISVAIVCMVLFSAIADAKEIYIDNNNQYTVSEGTVYWEKSEQLGSGKHNTVCNKNRYINMNSKKLTVWIDGYSVINQSGEIVKSYFDEKVKKLNIPSIDNKHELMVHIWDADDGHRLGWIKFSEVNFTENNPEYVSSEIAKGKEKEWLSDKSEEKTVGQTVDTLKKKVNEDSEVPRKSYILADFSGSMYDFQLDVLKKLNGTVGERYIFAEKVEKFNSEKETQSHNLGIFTNISKALNTINFENNSHIYILSDLNNNCGEQIESNKNFVGEITIVYYPVDYICALDFMEQVRDAYPNALLTGF